MSLKRGVPSLFGSQAAMANGCLSGRALQWNCAMLGLVWFLRVNITLCAAMTLPLVTRKLPNQSNSSTTLSAYFLKATPDPFSTGIGKRRSLIPFRLVTNGAVLFEADHRSTDHR